MSDLEINQDEPNFDALQSSHPGNDKKNEVNEVKEEMHRLQLSLLQKEDELFEIKKIALLSKGFKYINFVINKYLESPFFNETQRIQLIEFLNKINLQKNSSFIKIKTDNRKL